MITFVILAIIFIAPTITVSPHREGRGKGEGGRGEAEAGS